MAGREVRSRVTKCIFPPPSQKRSFLRNPDPSVTVAPRYPHPVLKTPSQIQILKAPDTMSFDKIVRRSLWLQNNNAYWVRQGEYTFTVIRLTN